MARRYAWTPLVSGVVLMASLSAGMAQGWTQTYIGAAVGVNAFTGHADLIDKSSNTAVLRGGGPFGSDIGANLTLGADYQLNRWLVLGGFMTYDWSGAAIKVKINEASANASADISVVSIDRMWTTGARLGVLISDSTLLYGLLGYSWIDVDDLKASVTTGGATTAFRLPLPSSKGVTIGAGFEHKLSDNVSLRTEYRMTDYGRETIFEDAILSVKGQASSHIARVGAFYRFGGGEAETVAQPAGRDHWAGLYAGIGLALAAYPRELDIRGTSPGHVDDHFVITGLGGGNVLASFSGGYDFRLAPRLVGGVVASLDLAGGSHGLTLSTAGGQARLDLLNQDYSWSVGGRIGYLVSPSLLAFLSAGYTQVQFDDAALTVAGATVFRFPFPRLSGGFVGVGFEKLLAPNLSVRSEYQFTQFESYTVDAFTTAGGDQARILFEPQSHAVKLSLGYRLGSGSSSSGD